MKELTEWTETDSKIETTNIGNFSAAQMKEQKYADIWPRSLWLDCCGQKKVQKRISELRLVELQGQREGKEEKKCNRERLGRVAAASCLRENWGWATFINMRVSFEVE